MAKICHFVCPPARPRPVGLEFKETNGINTENTVMRGEQSKSRSHLRTFGQFGPPKIILLFWRGPIPNPIKSSVGYLIPNTQILGRLDIGYG